MDKTTRAAIEKATQRARKLLEADFAEQVEGTYDVLPSGQVAPSGGSHLSDPAAAAPLLCAGITTWSPLRHWKVGRGQKVGVVGLGGLGHMGVKLAHALGANVVLFTTSPGKAEDARRLGADEVVISRNPEEMARHAGSFLFILNTVAAPHNLDASWSARRASRTLRPPS